MGLTGRRLHGGLGHLTQLHQQPRREDMLAVAFDIEGDQCGIAGDGSRNEKHCSEQCESADESGGNSGGHRSAPEDWRQLHP